MRRNSFDKTIIQKGSCWLPRGQTNNDYRTPHTNVGYTRVTLSMKRRRANLRSLQRCKQLKDDQALTRVVRALPCSNTKNSHCLKKLCRCKIDQFFDSLRSFFRPLRVSSCAETALIDVRETKWEKQQVVGGLCSHVVLSTAISKNSSCSTCARQVVSCGDVIHWVEEVALSCHSCTADTWVCFLYSKVLKSQPQRRIRVNSWKVLQQLQKIGLVSL